MQQFLNHTERSTGRKWEIFLNVLNFFKKLQNDLI